MRPRPETRPPDPDTRRLIFRLTVAGIGRLFLNTARRFPYPFAPALSRGLGVPLPGVTTIIALGQATSLLSPVFGPLGDRWGYRTLMLWGLWLLAGGMLLAGLWPIYGAVLVGLVFASLGKSIFDPAVQAYAGAHVPFERRGLAIGMGELSWSLSSFLGIPLVGIVIDRYGWRSPFFLLALLGTVSGLALALALPGTASSRGHEGAPSGSTISWGRLLRNRPALAGLGLGLFVAMANDNLFVVYGAWLERSFGLGVVALGAATTAIGAAEMAGEAATALLADRLGLARSLAVGVLATAGAYALLPFLGSTLPAAIAGLFVVFFVFEFTIVTSFSLCTEILPEARATMMSAYVAALGMGRVLGALVGGPLWLAGGLPAVGLTSALLHVLAFLCLMGGMRGWRDPN